MSKKDVRCICEEDEEKMDINSEENEAVTIGLDEGADDEVKKWMK